MSRLILIISSEFPPGPGGIGQHAFSLSKALIDEGYQVRVLSPADYATEEEIRAFDHKQSFTIKRYSRQSGWYTYIDRIRITFEEIRNSNVSTVILTGKFSLWQGVLMKLIYPDIKTLAVLHGSEVNLANRFLRWFTHKSIAIVDVIIPVSSFTKSLIPQWILQSHKQIEVIPNGIDQSPFSIKALSNIKLKGHPRLLTVGHVSPRKGQHRVIKALPNLLKRWPEIHYHIVGRTKNQKVLEELASQLEVHNHITFHGRIPEHQSLGVFYEQADVFMLLSENQPDGDVEGFGIVALEANLQGIPVVGAKYCGVEEAVNHLSSGYLVDGEKPDEIVVGVNFCIENRTELRQGAALWVEKHRWATIVKQYLKLLD